MPTGASVAAMTDTQLSIPSSTPLVAPTPLRPVFRPMANPLLFPPHLLWPNAHLWSSTSLPVFPFLSPHLQLAALKASKLPSSKFVTPSKAETATRQFKCPHCKKCYDTPSSFHMHVRTHMNGCDCPICGKTFSRHWLLQGHIRTHTGEKPFKCPVCSKAFADKSNLRAHIQTHSGVKPYVCKRCGKAFALKSYLSKHEESACFKTPATLIPLHASLGKAAGY